MSDESTKACGSCGGANPPEAVYCRHCDQPILADSLLRRTGKALRELAQPFIDFARAPRALWGVNVPYVLEGMVYFGMLNYLGIYFAEYVFSGMEDPDVPAGFLVGFLTAGITIAMFVLGFVADKWGVRRTLILAFALFLIGRALISAAAVTLEPAGLWSPLQLATMGGILFVVVGYGMYQPAAYAAVRQFTTPRTAGMAFAMLYALMNLGGWLPTFAFLLRDEDYLGMGISGVFWVYTGFTLLSLLLCASILSRRTVHKAHELARVERGQIEQGVLDKTGKVAMAVACRSCGRNLETLRRSDLCPKCGTAVLESLPPRVCGQCGQGEWQDAVTNCSACGHALPAGKEAVEAAAREKKKKEKVDQPGGLWAFIKRHPLADAKFSYFIFALIPVQTLFAYNWLILPQYISRAYAGSWIGDYYEIAVNLNPLLIFVFAPLIAAVTQQRNVYNMMIAGTLVMAAPAFLLVLGPHAWTLFGYILIMTVGEAMWQPRFLQYAAEIAPEGKTGLYMGVAQLPWFLTKLLVPLYTGFFLSRYCPPEGAVNTQPMWLIFACIAMCSTVLLMMAKGWIGRDFKAKAD